MDINTPEFREYFLNLSVVLTGFSKFQLQGTGLATLYFENIRDIIGEDIFGELLTNFHKLEVEKTEKNHESIKQILASEKFGPIARNIIKIWYIATWYALPQSWREVFGTKEKDGTFIISPQAYPEGLLWPAIGVNPPGAKGQGYGTWSEPPLVSLNKS
ncbi:hypothetical protein ACN23B_07885 [Anabaena sp. FACHB-709]|uniref:Uncharacterized protein n=2 Tax=Nostocaceae TaxID=1162 RepID=A0A1Z4KU50_ANAVA|nr:MULTISPECIES: hypothetical protein [Nostocaceae]BAY72556.1 hypothetical protein NIES23_53840 [Trichormus variabilis NIES-23]HBW31812.1 hypothetical protein [Nostoc sp. UBA8866]MBD2174531.1 hypothetical protein [Anabaena cylindrica FACHB-318]MBD2266315.1 hypothetical protein [Anabaena sp. FACHB-709]MBD2275707.1 hypothetical protein [Nostoc sp. PCC 7120 = FACHB-418]